MNRAWRCGNYELPLGRKTYVMGIVNVTPDSFSGDGRLGQAAIDGALRMVEGGADILDIGGESTRPGAEKIDAAEELRRVLPVVEALAARAGVSISVDTTKSTVAAAALEAGASIINDISAGTFDPALLGVVAKYGCGYILMHLRGTPQTMGWSSATGTAQGDVIEEVKAFWRARIEAARAAGVRDDTIALDPGFGFGKSIEENLSLLRRGAELAALGFPLLQATSRKSTIGKILDDALPEERLWGTAASVAIAIANGCDIVRVHDVAEMNQVARVADAIVRHDSA